VPEWEKVNEGEKMGRKVERRDKGKPEKKRRRVIRHQSRAGKAFFLSLFGAKTPSGSGPPHSRGF
jgi:hypothetical protein